MNKVYLSFAFSVVFGFRWHFASFAVVWSWRPDKIKTTKNVIRGGNFKRLTTGHQKAEDGTKSKRSVKFFTILSFIFHLFFFFFFLFFFYIISTVDIKMVQKLVFLPDNLNQAEYCNWQRLTRTVRIVRLWQHIIEYGPQPSWQFRCILGPRFLHC